MHPCNSRSCSVIYRAYCVAFLALLLSIAACGQYIEPEPIWLRPTAAHEISCHPVLDRFQGIRDRKACKTVRLQDVPPFKHGWRCQYISISNRAGRNNGYSQSIHKHAKERHLLEQALSFLQILASL